MTLPEGAQCTMSGTFCLIYTNQIMENVHKNTVYGLFRVIIRLKLRFRVSVRVRDRLVLTAS